MLLTNARAGAADFETIYTFTGNNETGGLPLALAPSGALVGFVQNTGKFGVGTAYSFTPDSATLAFGGNLKDGIPIDRPAVSAKGILFGVTQSGGYQCSANGEGCGVIFQIDPANQTYKRLHAFTGLADGGYPVAGLILGPNGKLYGTTEYGGSDACLDGCGTVFEFDPAKHVLTTLYSFSASPGFGPNSRLLFGKDGDIYGTTAGSSDSCNCGTIYKLNPKTKKITTIKTFTKLKDGTYPQGGDPYSGLAADGNGVIYGTTLSGMGGYGSGTVFEINPSTHKMTTLYGFSGGVDGALPEGVVPSATGTVLYGVTAYGGVVNDSCSYGCGTAFQLTPPVNGETSWVLSALHDFIDDADGAGPVGPLVVDSSGNMESTTSGGAGSNPVGGTIFRITP